MGHGEGGLFNWLRKGLRSIGQKQRMGRYMAADEGAFPRFSFGTTVNDLFRVIGRNFLLLCALALLLYGLPSAIFTIFIMGSVMSVFSNADSIGAPGVFDFLGMLGVTTIVGVAGSVLISIYTQGAMIWASLRDLAGDKPTFGGAMQAGLRFFLPILGLTLIIYIVLGALVAIPAMLAFGANTFGFAIALFLLVIIPLVLFLMVTLLASVPAIVSEHIGPIDAIGRSWDLSSGHRWKLFAMILIYGFTAMIISSAISGLTMPFVMVGDLDPSSPFGGLMPVMAIQSFLSSTTLVIAYPAIAATYHNLRNAKEGIRTEQVADIFE